MFKTQFKAIPEYIIRDFLQHIQLTGDPTTFKHITNQKPPTGLVEVLVQNFVVPEEHVSKRGLVPCPICSPKSPKYRKGHLIFACETGTIHAIGHECGHHYFDPQSLSQALRKREATDERKRLERFIELNWNLPKKLIEQYHSTHKRIRDFDQVTSAIRGQLKKAKCNSILKQTRQDGFLKIYQDVNRSDVMVGGLNSIVIPFGRRELGGVSILDTKSRNTMAREGLFRANFDQLIGLNWTSEDHAIEWTLSKSDDDLRQATRLIETTIKDFKNFEDQVSELLNFLDPANLELLSNWSCHVDVINFKNENDYVSLKIGSKNRNFRLPITLRTERFNPPKPITF